MRPVDLLLERMASFEQQPALIHNGTAVTYPDLLKRILSYSAKPGELVLIEGDYSPDSIALLIASLKERAIVTMGREASMDHPLITKLRKDNAPGLILFSSGTTAEPKAILHNADTFMGKFLRVTPRHQRVLAFMLFDHLGGLDTLFYTFFNLGTLITTPNRRPSTILQIIEKEKVETLPASPSFLQLTVATENLDQYDLSSLKKIAYGSEPMPPSLLHRLHSLLPDVKLTQTYGMSEIGVLSSVSQDSDSLWMRTERDPAKWRIVDGILQIQSKTSMMGYLNAPSPFTEDGWLLTGDLAEEKEGSLRILGRADNIVNVGGEKINPIEIESKILEIRGVKDVKVYGVHNQLIGQVLYADVVGDTSLELAIRRKCLKELPKFKVPAVIRFVEKITEKIKKERTE